MHLDVQLALRWNLVEATATSIALYIYNTQTVAGTLADTLEAGKQTWLDFLLQFSSFFLQVLLFLTSFLHDSVELSTLLNQTSFAVLLLC